VDPLRGDVWDARLPRAGEHPVVVLTINVLIPRLSAVTVAVVTGTEGPPQTQIPLDRDVGLTGYDVSYVNATDLHSIDKSRLRRRRGRLHPRELTHLEEAVRLYLGLLRSVGAHVIRLCLTSRGGNDECEPGRPPRRAGTRARGAPPGPASPGSGPHQSRIRPASNFKTSTMETFFCT
jgi:mRNA interferase MazF